MPEIAQIFENEEAEIFLDYFIVYKKFLSKADNFKRILTLNAQIALGDNTTHSPIAEPLDSVVESQSSIGLVSTSAAAESTPTRL